MDDFVQNAQRDKKNAEKDRYNSQTKTRVIPILPSFFCISTKMTG